MGGKESVSVVCAICGKQKSERRRKCIKLKIVTENEISYLIRGAIIKIFKRLGPGLFENVYKRILKYELEKLGLQVKAELRFPLIYEDTKLDIGFRIDLIVNDLVIIEVKSVEKLTEIHHKQTITYLKLTGIKLGILVNFNYYNIVKDIHRKVNNL